jgi:hypothetical protein
VAQTEHARKVAELSAARDEIERGERAERKGGRT